MQEHPLISVVIPNWNGAQHLPTCLDSLRRQTYPRYEVIVADNNSRDESVDLLRSDYPEVRVVALKENLGYAGRVEAALTEAGIRTKLDDTKERMAHKIRDAELMKVPAIFVVGKKEEEAGTVSVRERGKGDQGAVALDEAVAKLKKEIETKSTGQI